MSKPLIIIPTYNEAENILTLVRRLVELYPTCEVMVVDDGNDGTDAVIRDASAQDPRIRLLKRAVKSGRGTAVLEGIRFGLQHGFNPLIEMDADFSHDPTELAKLFAVAHEADVVIGSRYIRASRIVGWPIYRQIFSRVANVFARAVLGIPIADYTNGYRLYNKKAADLIGPMTITSKGYIVLSEIAYPLYRAGCTFKEVPTVFVNRKRGESSFSLKEIREAFTSILKIKKRFSDSP